MFKGFLSREILDIIEKSRVTRSTRILGQRRALSQGAIIILTKQRLYKIFGLFIELWRKFNLIAPLSQTLFVQLMGGLYHTQIVWNSLNTYTIVATSCQFTNQRSPPTSFDDVKKALAEGERSSGIVSEFNIAKWFGQGSYSSTTDAIHDYLLKAKRAEQSRQRSQQLWKIGIFSDF